MTAAAADWAAEIKNPDMRAQLAARLLRACASFTEAIAVTGKGRRSLWMLTATLHETRDLHHDLERGHTT